jgi:hypothetical protein
MGYLPDFFNVSDDEKPLPKGGRGVSFPAPSESGSVHSGTKKKQKKKSSLRKMYSVTNELDRLYRYSLNKE